jgi:hypothetical protein
MLAVRSNQARKRGKTRADDPMNARLLLLITALSLGARKSADDGLARRLIT